MNEHFGPVVASTDKLKAISCERCGYVHLDPLPTQDELDRLYTDEYYQTYNAGWFEKERREQWYWRKVYEQRLRFYELARRQPAERCHFILDYGAGCGWFIVEADRYFYDYVGSCIIRGIEPNLSARLWAQKNTCLVLEQEWVDFDAWDFIHASLVLEHLLDPLAFLGRAYDNLKPGGILCIIVPNEFNLYQYQLKRFGYTPLHEHHLNYFTPHSLKSLCQKAGFEIVRHTSTFPMEWFALHGLNYVKYPRLGKVAHRARMALEWAGLSLAPERWERKRDGWAGRGVGREIELWVKKV